jgi:hypothetical protein
MGVRKWVKNWELRCVCTVFLGFGVIIMFFGRKSGFSIENGAKMSENGAKMRLIICMKFLFFLRILWFENGRQMGAFIKNS